MTSQLPFTEAHLGLNVHIVSCRCLSGTSIWERVMGSAEFFVQICCEAAEGPDEFFTKSYKRSKSIAVSERFTFVVTQRPAKTAESPKPLTMQVTLYKNSHKFGKSEFDITNVEMLHSQKMTIDFTHNQEIVKLDIEFEKKMVSNPDFRYSLKLFDQELDAISKRRQRVFENIKSFLPEINVQSADEVPSIAIACSGGGYRATTQFCGAIEAARDSGLLDCVTHLAGLSGGSWYIIPAYVKKAFKDPDSLLDYHSEIKNAAKSSLIINSLADLAHYLKYRKYARSRELEGQRVTFVDFYGFSVGRTFLGYDIIDTKFSDIRDYAASGEVPIPVITSLHTKSKVSSVTFSADLDITPWEASLPHYAINVPIEKFGSEWYKGSLVRACPEYPLHFFMGASSIAFGILLKYYLKGETTEADKNFVAAVRNHQFGRHFTKRGSSSVQDKSHISTRRKQFAKHAEKSNDDADDEVFQRRKSRSCTKRKRRMSHLQQLSDNLDSAAASVNKAEDDTNIMNTIRRRTCRFSMTSEYETASEGESETNVVSDFSSTAAKSKFGNAETARPKSERNFNMNANTQKNGEETDKPKDQARFKKLLKQISNHPLFTDREAVIDRTAKILNVARGFSGVEYHHLNPDHPVTSGERENQNISTTDDVITFVDPAVISNVPCNALLRRKVDILIVCDATEYKSDTDIDYLELFLSESAARKQGLKFPKIDPQKLKDDPRGIAHVFEDPDDPECPIVIWFTLCNKEFKALKNVPFPPRRKIDENYELPSNEVFNVFPVYGPASPYQTLNTRYTPLQFDRLRALMKHSINSNMETIKRTICTKIQQKQASTKR